VAQRNHGVQLREQAADDPVASESGRVTLSTRSEVLVALARASRESIRQPFPEVDVRLPGLASGTALKAQLRINQAAVDCGCATGSAAITFAALLCAALLWIAAGSPTGDDWPQRLAAGLVMLAAAVVGKLVGLLRARRRLIDELAALTALADQPAREEG
jgi:hypothetical protein